MHALSTKQLITLGIGLIVIAVLLALFGAWPSSSPQNSASSSKTLPAPTPPTQAQLQQLQNSPPFQYLVSYTSAGFEPRSLTIKEGQTVRFADNSSQQLWVASIGEGSDQIYPGTSQCGGSAFDSCGPLQPGDFWEFTFTQSGAYDFQNNSNPAKLGTITVQ